MQCQVMPDRHGERRILLLRKISAVLGKRCRRPCLQRRSPNLMLPSPEDPTAIRASSVLSRRRSARQDEGSLLRLLRRAAPGGVLSATSAQLHQLRHYFANAILCSITIGSSGVISAKNAVPPDHPGLPKNFSKFHRISSDRWRTPFAYHPFVKPLFSAHLPLAQRLSVLIRRMARVAIHINFALNASGTDARCWRNRF